jgi:hypothetical protein
MYVTTLQSGLWKKATSIVTMAMHFIKNGNENNEPFSPYRRWANKNANLYLKPFVYTSSEITYIIPAASPTFSSTFHLKIVIKQLYPF